MANVAKPRVRAPRHIDSDRIVKVKPHVWRFMTSKCVASIEKVMNGLYAVTLAGRPGTRIMKLAVGYGHSKIEALREAFQNAASSHSYVF